MPEHLTHPTRLMMMTTVVALVGALAACLSPADGRNAASEAMLFSMNDESSATLRSGSSAHADATPVTPMKTVGAHPGRE